MRWRNRQPKRRCPAECGYVLVEILVSLAILALMLSLLPGMLRLGSRASESARAIESADASEAALSLLRRTIEGALPFYETDEQGAFGIAFRGEADMLELIGELPGPRAGGLARYRLGYSASRSGIALRYTRFVADRRRPGPAQDMSEIAILSNHTLSLRYFGRMSRGAPEQWHARWQSTEALPRIIEVSLEPQTPGGRAQRMSVELRLKP